MEKTVILIKPDAVERNLTDDIIRRYEETGLKITAKKTIQAGEELLKKHYPDSLAEQLGEKAARAGDERAEGNEKEFGFRVLSWLREYISSAPVIVMILEGENAVQRARDVTGYTDPGKAEKGTLRGDLGNDSLRESNRNNRAVRNLVHASGSREEAEKEITLWFPDF